MSKRRSDGDFSSQMAVFTIRAIIAFFMALWMVLMWAWHRRKQKNPDEISMQGTWFGVGFAVVAFIATAIFAYLASHSQSYSLYSGIASMTALLGFVVLFFAVSGDIGKLSWGTKPEATIEATVSIVEPVSLSFEILLPRDSQWQAGAWLAFTNSILQLPEMLLSIEASAESIRWKITLLNPEERFISVLQSHVHSQFPEAEIHPVEFKYPYSSPVYRYTAFYEQAAEFVMPMKYIQDLQENDVLAALTEAISNLQANERVEYILGVKGLDLAAYERGKAMISQSTIHPLQYFSPEGIGRAFFQKLAKADRVERYIPSDQKVLEGKLREKLFRAAFIVQIDSPETARVDELMLAVDAQIANFVRMPYNGLLFKDRPLEAAASYLESEMAFRASEPSKLFRSFFQEKKTAFHPPALILEPREIAAIWHLPYEKMAARRISWSKTSRAVPESLSRNQNGVRLGMGQQGHGQTVPVTLAYADRATHMSIIGRTGTGKSNLMHHLIHHDIANGHGVAVLDPHGDLIERILESSIPNGREGDVILLDLADRDYPAPLNPLRQRGQQSLLGIITIIERLFTETEEKARLSQTLRATIQLLAFEEQPTLRDAARILVDDLYRGKLLGKCDIPEVRDYWNFQYNNQKIGFRTQIAEPIMNRIRPFYGNPYLYPVICHPQAIDFEAAVREKKIILISLDVDESDVPKLERDLIGSMLTSRLQAAGMKRRNQAEDATFYLYIDEVQRFSTSSLDTIFSEARKYQVSLTVAHQYLEQLEDSLLQSILGNVGTTVVFRSNPLDTSKLALYMQPEFSRADLLSLDRFQAAVKLQHENQTQPAFTLYPDPPLSPPKGSEAAQKAKKRAQSLREGARTQLMSREAVLAWLKQHYEEVDKPSYILPANPETFVESSDGSA